MTLSISSRLWVTNGHAAICQDHFAKYSDGCSLIFIAFVNIDACSVISIALATR